jgi:hypothetical protein
MKDDAPIVADQELKLTMCSRAHAEAHRRAQMVFLLVAPVTCQKAVAWILGVLRQPLCISSQKEKTLAGRIIYGLAACRECQSPFLRKKSWQSFCDQPCRATWHNKRRPQNPSGVSTLSSSQTQSQNASDPASKNHMVGSVADRAAKNTASGDGGRNFAILNADMRGIEE